MEIYNNLLVSYSDLDLEQMYGEVLNKLENMVNDMNLLLHQSGITSDIELPERKFFDNFDDKKNYLLYCFALLMKLESQISDYAESKKTF